MSKLRVQRPHTMGRERALQAALQVAERLRDRAQVKFTVAGHVIEFSRSGGSGRIIVEEDSITAEVTLGLALRPMKGLIERKIDEYFARYMD